MTPKQSSQGEPGATFKNAPKLKDESDAATSAQKTDQVQDPINRVNERAIGVQQTDGIDVGPDWWRTNVTEVVGDDAGEETMFGQFMEAYERDFPVGPDGRRHPKA